MGIEIITGARSRPQKIVTYGPEGVGKTTLAAQYPSPLFADCEGGTDHIDLARIDIKTIGDFREACMYLIREPHDFKTFVVDTVDWLAAQDVAEMIKEDGIDSVEDYGYGKGYKKAEERFVTLLDLLERVQRKGIHVLLLGHSKVTKFEEPDKGGSYDRYSLKLEKKIEPLVKEWCDALLFLNYETKIIEREKGSEKKRGKSTGKRIVHCTREAAFDAKNRHGMPDQVAANIDELSPIINFKGNSQSSKTSSSINESKDIVNDDNQSLDESFAKVVESAGGEKTVNAFLGARNLSIATLEDDYKRRVIASADAFVKQVSDHSTVD